MRIAKVLILFLCMLLLLAACMPHDRMFGLAACGSFGVPGMYCYDLKGGSFQCEILDTDSRGRVLFAYTAKNIITGQKETALVICQTNKNRQVRFYEDICYYFGKAEGEAFLAFKERNDWNAPLNQDRMVSRRYIISFGVTLDYPSGLSHQKVEKACAGSVSVETQEIRELCILDINSYGQGLYWMETDQQGALSRYFVIVHPDYKVEILEAQGLLEDLENLAAWKAQVGWNQK